MIDSTRSVADLVLDHSECAPVFQRYRIDFCCRGNQSIADACARAGADPQVVLDELARAIAERSGTRGRDPRTMATATLIEHIVDRHHVYLREVLPFVTGLAAKVSRVHGDHNPKLRELDRVVRALSDALLPHLDDEEQTLFPLLASEHPDRAQAVRELQAMQDEHLEVADLLARMRAAADDYRLPDWACNSYRALFAELAQLETDTFTHVHLENHVLAPRFASA